MRIRAVIALGVLVLSAHVGADTYPRQPAIDVIHYVFRLSLMPGTDHRITGDTTVGIRINTAGTREVALDLASAANGTGMTVTSVVSGAEPLNFTHAANRLVVMFAEPTRAGERVTLTIKYHGVAAAGLTFITNMHGEPTVFSGSWPNLAHQWLPTLDLRLA